MVFRNQCGIEGVEMRNMAIAAKAIALIVVSTAGVGCAQLSADQTELAKVHWIIGLKEIILAGDFSNYTNVAKQLNLDLAAKSPIPVKNVDGAITGESFDVDTVPPANEENRKKIQFYYGVYTPSDRSYRRAILMINNLSLYECLTESDIFRTFGQIRRTTYAHSPNYSIDYHFKGDNDIDLLFRFENSSEKCADQINVFQNRRK
jgi:hypothetical protein